jgi:hypothetical protein
MNWFVIRNGKEQGPFSAAQLRQFAASDQIKRNDQLRREDMTQPVVAESIKGLFESAVQTKPTQVSPTPAGLDASNPSAAKSPLNFREWYQPRIGRLPVVAQVLLWLFYGFIWIPIWWSITTRRKAIGISLAIVVLIAVALQKKNSSNNSGGITEITSPEIRAELEANRAPLVGRAAAGDTEAQQETTRLIDDAKEREAAYRAEKAQRENYGEGGPPWKGESGKLYSIERMSAFTNIPKEAVNLLGDQQLMLLERYDKEDKYGEVLAKKVRNRFGMEQAQKKLDERWEKENKKYLATILEKTSFTWVGQARFHDADYLGLVFGGYNHACELRDPYVPIGGDGYLLKEPLFSIEFDLTENATQQFNEQLMQIESGDWVMVEVNWNISPKEVKFDTKEFIPKLYISQDDSTSFSVSENGHTLACR